MDVSLGWDSLTQIKGLILYSHNVIHQHPLSPSPVPECDCDFQGTEERGCEAATGRCLCRAGVTGQRCDRCQRGHCSSQPGCQPCHPCFHVLDGDIQLLLRRQAGLANATARLPAGTGGSQLGPRLSRAQDNLQQALGILGHPAGTQQGLAQAGSALAAIR